MKGTCYWCNKEIPDGQVKRCSRCRLTVYCSKECQTASWKTGHKANCTPNPLFNAPDGTAMPKPDKFSDEWVEQQVDKRLSAWLQAWRATFCQFAILSLDLPNHPRDRNVTHCMTLWVRANVLHEDRMRDYWIKKAEVRTIAELQSELPELAGLFSGDPADPTKLRYVVLLENDEGELRRGRCLQFNHRGLDHLRTMPKDMFAGQPLEWSDILKYTVDQSTPGETMAKFSPDT